jgi:hypothetical protein
MWLRSGRDSILGHLFAMWKLFLLKLGILLAVSIWYGNAKMDRMFWVYHSLRSVSSDFAEC